MKRILAIAAAAAAITAGASAANAQDCENGVMMRGNVPTACGGANGAGDVNGNADELPTAAPSGDRGFFRSLFGNGTATSAVDAGGANGAGDVNGNADEIATDSQGSFANTEPLYTGSIAGGANDAGVPGNADQLPDGLRFVASQEECQPGMWYMQDMQSQNRPQRC